MLVPSTPVALAPFTSIEIDRAQHSGLFQPLRVPAPPNHEHLPRMCLLFSVTEAVWDQ